MDKEADDGPRGRVATLLSGFVAGVRWIILVALVLAVLVAAVFGRLWESVVVALFGFALTHVATRWRDNEAEERSQRRETRAHEREREQAMTVDRQLRERELKAALQQRRIEGYRGFVYSFFDSMLPLVQKELANRQSQDHDEGAEANIALNNMMKNLTLWGDDEVLLRFLVLIDGYCKGQTKAPLPDVDALCELFLSIRRNLEYENEGLDKYRLYPIFGIHPPATVPAGSPEGGGSG